MVRNEAEAEVVRGLLGNEGIVSMHRPTNFGAGSMDGFTPTGAREVVVRAEQLAAARAVLAGADE